MEHVFIKEVEVRGLFGYADYSFSRLAQKPNFADFLILHGDNGTGKTTLLWMITALLSCRSRDRSKSYLTNVRFTFFEVTLSTNVRFQASRTAEIGDYVFKLIAKDNKVLYEFHFKSIKDPKYSKSKSIVELTPAQVEEYDEYLNAIKNIGVNITLITHSRKILRTFDELGQSEVFMDYDGTEHQNFFDEEVKDHTKLKEAKKEVEKWLETETRKASDLGMYNSNKIYINLLKSLTNRDEIISSINEDVLNTMMIRNTFLSSYGLMPNLDFKQFIDELAKLNDQKKDEGYRIFEYYLSTIIKKQEALLKTGELIKSFLNAVNGFLRDKKMYYQVDKGFFIPARNSNGNLSLELLSSGEIQLLLILFNALRANVDEIGDIIIIDEPEISLNIVWQRNLIKTLKSISDHSPIQFILATHSMEIIGQNLDNLIDLNVTNG